MKQIIHINQHIIKHNRKTGDMQAPITVKTYKSNDKHYEFYIDGPCTIRYEPDNPLPCGAHVWIEREI